MKQLTTSTRAASPGCGRVRQAGPAARRRGLRGIRLQKTTLALIQADRIAKGNVLATARLAGILAAKRTGDLIPLCHPLAISHCAVEFEIRRAATGSSSRPREGGRADRGGDGGPDRRERRRPHHL